MAKKEYIDSLPKGTKISHYEILEVLGEGGFGIVYKALNLKIDKIVAIKEFMPKDITSRSYNNATISCNTDNKELFEWGMERFLNEAKTLAQFDHPAIVKIYDYFEDNNTAYFVMDYYDSEVLSSYLERHPNKVYTQKDILSIIMPILEGLKDIHAKGFLHRDISPDNILLRKNRLPVLIDFGSARSALKNKSKLISSIIKEGYSSPEQYTSTSKQNNTSDLYSISAVIYKMITKEKPSGAIYRQTELFNGNSDPLEDITIKYKDKYNESFLATIQKGLELKQKDRIQTIEEYQKGLVEGVIEEKKTPQNPYEILDDLINIAGSDKVITKNEENMILSKAKELGLDVDKAKEYLNSAITKYGWKRKNIEEDEIEKKSENKSNKKTYINPCKALEDTIMSAGSNKVITKDDIKTILQKAKELNIEEDRAKACIEVAIRTYEWKKEEQSKNTDLALKPGTKILNYKILSILQQDKNSISYIAKDINSIHSEVVTLIEYLPQDLITSRDKNNTLLIKDTTAFNIGKQQFLKAYKPQSNKTFYLNNTVYIEKYKKTYLDENNKNDNKDEKSNIDNIFFTLLMIVGIIILILLINQ